jgi:Omp85 superfamily domain
MVPTWYSGCNKPSDVSSSALRRLERRNHERPRSVSYAVAAAVAATTALTATAAADVPTEDEHKAGREVGLLPLIGGDTDNGFGVGAIGTIAEFDANNPLYRWKLDFAGFYATKTFPPTPSYIDGAIKLTVPELLDDHLRVEVRPSFTLDSALPFFGIGNRPPIPPTIVASRDFYERLHPALMVAMRWRLSRHWFALDGAQLIYNKVSVAPDSTLARELAAIDPYLTSAHGLLRVDAGLVYDSRDNEIAPNSGQYHQVKVRLSPHVGDELPYAFEQYDAIGRFYTTLMPHRLVLALRGVVDVQTGNVPFYEESRYEDASAIGGPLGVRGVPAYQFYGRAKAFGSVELRAKLWRFAAASRRFTIGFAGFVDAGRVWTDVYAEHHALDGTGVGIHYGIGGGLRVQQGRAFLVRVDVAWSPDARPIGAYVMADEAF